MTVRGQILSWQQKNWNLLHSYIKQGRIPQAVLISGARGIGKQGLAERFASALLCHAPQDDGLCCGMCNSCVLIKADTHPDLIHVTPDDEKKSISINQIRHVVADTYLKPQFETYRTVIINPADALTTSAANAFLKCLEEPTERTVFILITDKPGKLPATIISRCQKLALTFPGHQILVDWLRGQGIIQNHDTLINLLRASLIEAPEMANQDLHKQRVACFNDWLAIANHSNHPAIVAEKWQKLPMADLLLWLISWVADLIKCTFRIEKARLCNQDFVKPLQDLAQQLELKSIYHLYGQLLNSRRLLDTQINSQMMVEEILVQWQELNRRN